MEVAEATVEAAAVLEATVEATEGVGEQIKVIHKNRNKRCINIKRRPSLMFPI